MSKQGFPPCTRLKAEGLKNSVSPSAKIDLFLNTPLHRQVHMGIPKGPCSFGGCRAAPCSFIPHPAKGGIVH